MSAHNSQAPSKAKSGLDPYYPTTEQKELTQSGDYRVPGMARRSKVTAAELKC